MKGKILSVLFCLMLAFGMIFAACDNGPIIEDTSSKTGGVYDGKDKVLDFSGHGRNQAGTFTTRH